MANESGTAVLEEIRVLEKLFGCTWFIMNTNRDGFLMPGQHAKAKPARGKKITMSPQVLQDGAAVSRDS